MRIRRSWLECGLENDSSAFGLPVVSETQGEVRMGSLRQRRSLASILSWLDPLIDETGMQM